MRNCRPYILWLAVVTLALVVASFVVMWATSGTYIAAMSWLPLYFAAVTGLQHLLVVRAMNQSPKTFVQVFLGSTIGVLFIHLIVLASFLLTNASQGHRFLIAFCIGYVAYLAFETVALVKFVEREKRRRQQS